MPASGYETSTGLLAVINGVFKTAERGGKEDQLSDVP